MVESRGGAAVACRKVVGGTIEVEGRSIKVGVSPGLPATAEQLIPLGRTGTPEEAAGAVHLLRMPESDYVSAQTLVCGGGLSL
ncbi:SDR family oxidoreductase [Actinomadura sp. 7K507]|uniref:SDR family oxidoreductase n=1 Tax=Actinomadura sp. 7K507 TaxID=2530365 RepID=UPI001FB7E620|nr:SDR family oxidoreductase [Actinomadura sp. 7K507]